MQNKHNKQAKEKWIKHKILSGIHKWAPKTSKIIGTKVWVCDMQDSNKNTEKPIHNTEPCAACILLVKCCELVMDNAQNEWRKTLKNITY